MSRTSALWISAILTLAAVLIVGTMLLRSDLSQPTAAQAQQTSSLTSDTNSSLLNAPVQTEGSEYQGDDHDTSEHHDHDKEHQDDD